MSAEELGSTPEDELERYQFQEETELDDIDVMISVIEEHRDDVRRFAVSEGRKFLRSMSMIHRNLVRISEAVDVVDDVLGADEEKIRPTEFLRGIYSAAWFYAQVYEEDPPYFMKAAALILPRSSMFSAGDFDEREARRINGDTYIGIGEQFLGDNEDLRESVVEELENILGVNPIALKQFRAGFGIGYRLSVEARRAHEAPLLKRREEELEKRKQADIDTAVENAVNSVDWDEMLAAIVEDEEGEDDSRI